MHNINERREGCMNRKEMYPYRNMTKTEIILSFLAIGCMCLGVFKMLNDDPIGPIILMIAMALLLPLVMKGQHEIKENRANEAKSLRLKRVHGERINRLFKKSRFSLLNVRLSVMKDYFHGVYAGYPVTLFKFIKADIAKKVAQQTVVYVRMPSGLLPKFIVKPQGIMHSIKRLVGFEDINFEEYPEFSSRYILHGESERRVRTLFSNRLIKFFESEPFLVVETHRDGFIIFRDGELAGPGGMEMHLKRSTDMANAMKTSCTLEIGRKT
jgi:hypothetical protein